MDEKGGAMRHLTRGLAPLALVSLAFFAVACNKGPAEEALRLADQALAAAKPELERYAPEELAALTAAAQQARAELDEGHYTDALRVAQGLPARIRAGLAAAAAEKERRVSAWHEMEASVPGLVRAIAARVADLAAAQRLPRGMDDARFAAARTDLESVARAWSAAAAAFQGGDVPRAVRTAKDVKAKAEALAAMLGVVAAPAPSAAASAPAP
jgi:hypothetical protein